MQLDLARKSGTSSGGSRMMRSGRRSSEDSQDPKDWRDMRVKEDKKKTMSSFFAFKTRSP